jgi:hypothetical protein
MEAGFVGGKILGKAFDHPTIQIPGNDLHFLHGSSLTFPVSPRSSRNSDSFPEHPSLMVS